MLFTLSITARCAPSYALHVRARLLQWIDQWIKWHTLLQNIACPLIARLQGMFAQSHNMHDHVVSSADVIIVERAR